MTPKPLTRALLLIFFLFPVGFGSQLEAQLDPISGLLADLERRANNVVQTAGAEGRGVAIAAGQQALNAIGALKAAYASSLEKTLDGVTKVERKTYEDIQALIVSAEKGGTDLTSRMETVAQQLNGVAQNLPGGKKIPILLAVSPQYFLPGDTQPLSIVMRGMNLSFEEPILRLGETQLKPSRELDNELIFELPASLVNSSSTGGQALRGELKIFERHTKWLIFSEHVPHTYQVALFSLPRSLGQFEMIAKRQVPTVVREERRTSSFNCASPRGEGSHSVPVQIVATPGWQIDTTTIRYQQEFSSEGRHSFETQASTGFTATLRCYGTGIIRVFGVVVDWGKIGVENGHYTYTEFRATTQEQLQQVRSGPLGWGESVLVANLPPDTSTVLVNFNPFAGTPTAAQGTDLGNRFFTLDYNAAAKTAKLTGRGPEEVMGR